MNIDKDFVACILGLELVLYGLRMVCNKTF